MSKYRGFLLALLDDFFLNSFLIVSLIFSVICMINWYQYFFKVIKIKNEFIDKLNPKSQNDVIDCGIAFRTFINCVSFNFLFMFLKLLRYVSSLLNRTKIFFDALNLATNDMVGLIIFFTTVLLAFVLMSNLYFGKFVTEFSTFANSFQINFSLVLGDVNRKLNQNMLNYSSTFTTIYIILICLVLKYIILRVFLAIIMYYYKCSLDKYNSENRDTSSSIQTWKEAREKFKKNECVQFAKMYNDFVNNIWNLLLCIWCKKKEEDSGVNVEMKNKEKINNDLEKEIESEKGHDGITDQDFLNNKPIPVESKNYQNNFEDRIRKEKEEVSLYLIRILK